jgi:hypothetical protein
MRSVIIPFVLFSFALVTSLASASNQSGAGDIGEILWPSDFARRLVETLLQELIKNLIGDDFSSSATNLFNADYRLLSNLINSAMLFLGTLAMSLFQLAFGIGLAFWVAPLDLITDEFREIGRKSMFDALTGVLLLVFFPAINAFLFHLSAVLTDAVWSPVDLAVYVVLLAASGVSPAGIVVFFLNAISIVLAISLLALAFALQPFAPIFFVVGLSTWALPFRIAKNAGDSLIATSLVLYFAKPVGAALVVVHYSILGSLGPLNPLAPIVAFLAVLFFFHLFFRILREMRAYPLMTKISSITAYALLGFSAGRLIPVMFRRAPRPSKIMHVIHHRGRSSRKERKEVIRKK